MSRGPDAATLIERALLASAERAACPVSLADSEMKRWDAVVKQVGIKGE